MCGFALPTNATLAIVLSKYQPNLMRRLRLQILHEFGEVATPDGSTMSFDLENTDWLKESQEK